MCGSMVDIQSAADENRRGKREKRRNQLRNIVACPNGRGHKQFMAIALGHDVLSARKRIAGVW